MCVFDVRMYSCMNWREKKNHQVDVIIQYKIANHSINASRTSEVRTEQKKCFFNTSFLGVCVLFLLFRSQFIHFAPFITLCTLCRIFDSILFHLYVCIFLQSELVSSFSSHSKFKMNLQLFFCNIFHYFLLLSERSEKNRLCSFHVLVTVSMLRT